MIKEKYYSSGCNKLLRAGVSLALVAGMSVPSAQALAETTKDATKAKTDVEQVDAKEKTVDTTAEKATEDTKVSTKDATVEKDAKSTDVSETNEKVAEKVTTSNDVSLASAEDEQVSLLGAEDPYLTDKVVVGDASTGVYMSVKGTAANPYLYMEPINGNSASVTVGFYDWDTYIASDYYTKVVAPYANKITRIEVADGANVKLSKNCSCLFSGLPALTDISDLAKLDTSEMTQMAEMFSCDAALTDLSPIAGWNVSNVKMMYLAFRECTLLTSIAPLSSWTTTSLTDVSGMFYKCESLVDISALANFNTANVDEMYNMLSGCAYLTDISALQNWQTGKVTNMTGVFGGCSSLSDFSPVANWDLSSNTQLQGTFAGCAMTNTDDLAKWGQQGNVENISMCFAGCPNLSDLTGLSGWTIKPTVAQYVFMSCPSLKTLDGLENWDMSQCQYFTYMFCADTALEDASAIGDWQPGSAIDMSAMFANDVALNTVDLNPLANNAAQTQAFAGIDTSNVRHFKVPELQSDLEAIMAENNICDIQNMEGENFLYKLRGTNTTYASWQEVLENWDEFSGQWIDIIEDKEITITYYVYSAGFPVEEKEGKDFDPSTARLIQKKTETIRAVTGTPAGCDIRMIPEIDGGGYSENTDDNEEWYQLWERVDTGDDVSLDMHFIPEKNEYGEYEAHSYLTAVFPRSFEITYSGVDGLDNPNPTDYTVEDDFTLLPVEKEGYTFVGWFDEDDNKVTTTGTKVGGYELSAKFEPIKYDITYSGVDGLDNLNPTQYDVENNITLQPVEKPGYTFIGWFDESGNQVTDTGTKTGDLKLIAKFEAITYDIEYNGVEGLDNPNPTTYTVDKSIVLQPIEKEGYTFIGWFDESGNQVTDTGTKTGGLKLTASWTPIEYKITYAGLEDAVTNNPTTYTIESNTIILTNPVRVGYTFKGWFNGNQQVADIKTGSIGDMTLTAKWEKDAVDNTTDENGQIVVTDPTTGEDIVITVKDDTNEPVKDAVVTIDENGKVNIELPDNASGKMNVNISDEEGTGIENKQATIVYKDGVTFDGVSDANGDVVWIVTPDADDDNTDTDATTTDNNGSTSDNSGSSSSPTNSGSATSSSMPQTGDDTLYATLLAAVTGAGALGFIGRRRALNESLKNRKH